MILGALVADEDYYRDFADTAKLAVAPGAQAIDLNLSCPNVVNEGILCYNYDEPDNQRATDNMTLITCNFRQNRR